MRVDGRQDLPGGLVNRLTSGGHIAAAVWHDGMVVKPGGKGVDHLPGLCGFWLSDGRGHRLEGGGGDYGCSWHQVGPWGQAMDNGVGVCPSIGPWALEAIVSGVKADATRDEEASEVCLDVDGMDIEVIEVVAGWCEDHGGADGREREACGSLHGTTPLLALIDRQNSGQDAAILGAVRQYQRAVARRSPRSMR